MPSDKQFDFGSNWQRFLDDHFSPERVALAEESLRKLLSVSDLKGRTFVDIGCGSGLFSLAACRLGAASIVSLDINEQSVECCMRLKDWAGRPSNWEVYIGSILDPTLLSRVPKADVVYSWGVLHHTGDMWAGIHNAAALVKPGGLLAIGIYNYRSGRKGTETWQRLKRWYCNAPRWQATLWEWVYIGWNLIYLCVVGRNPLTFVRDYKKDRGMSWFRDVTDWLGGYPYEAATPGEVLERIRRHFGYLLIKQSINCDLGVSEFVFQAQASD
jgi:2-polyprenyl-6-hydroxyphenyl methylase/3-demethylubiquinone-9 3-methyltransferase